MTALDLLYLFLTPPLCASVAGAVVWASNRTQTLEDSSLIRQFLLILTICFGLAWGISRTDTARMHLDPQLRLQTQLDAHPVYAAIKQWGSNQKALHEFLTAQVAQGKTLDEAFVQARGLLTDRARDQLGFVEP